MNFFDKPYTTQQTYFDTPQEPPHIADVSITPLHYGDPEVKTPLGLCYDTKKTITNEKMIDVFVITYCSAKYVLQTLDSIYAQTYPDIRLIISDDCSKDDTIDVCRAWLEAHKERFVYVELLEATHNQGIVFNCKKALERLEAPYYLLIAGDDYIAPTHIEKCLDKYREMPEAGFVYTSSNLVIESEGKIIHEDVSNFREGNIFDDLLLLNFWPKSGGFLFRTEAAKSIGEHNTSIWVEDFDYALRLAKKYPVGWVKEFSMFYRLHDANAGGDSIRLLTALLDTILQYQSHPLYEKAYDYLEKRLIDVAQKENPLWLLRTAIKKGNVRYLKAYLYALIYTAKQYAKTFYYHHYIQ